MKEFFTLPSGLFFSMVAPLYLEELVSIAPDARGISSQPRVVPRPVVQYPLVSLNTSLAMICGRYREPLPVTVANSTCMPQFHTSQGWEIVQCS
jgi:hypothetical protein